MILVTGGAGYIGSHTIASLLESGEKVVALDSLYSGHRKAVPEDVPLIVGEAGNTVLLKRVIEKFKVDSVIHFAAHLEVEESTRDPFKYYENNFVQSIRLIDLCQFMGIRHFVFSSSCAVYGSPSSSPVKENSPLNPINPYGRSKRMTETFLEEMRSAHDQFPSFVSLRYFNVAGAHSNGHLGQSTPKATQLIKVASEVICGKRPSLKVFGTDYPTSDGTCVRDYLHVQDLAQAHTHALRYLRSGGESTFLNCGYGQGFSVLEVIKTLKEVSGSDFPVEYSGRRSGDAPSIYADPTELKSKLHWRPKFQDLRLICESTLRWEKNRTY